MIPPDILMLMVELQMASGRPYPVSSRPLSEARRYAQRLMFAITALSIPPLACAALGLAIFLSGHASLLVGAIEIVIIGLSAAVQIILIRRLAHLRQLSRMDAAAYQGDWLPFTQVEELIDRKYRKAVTCTILGCLPLLTVATAPVGIVHAAESLQLIRYFGVGKPHETSSRVIIVLNALLMLIYASLLALLPLFMISSRY